jgi:Homeodomain-like domain-containing protein
MLVELSVVEQRYHAVMEVVCGIPVVEVAERYGVSRKTVHTWLGRYRKDGLTGLTDRSIARITTRVSWPHRLRRGCASCAGPIPAGDPAGWSTNCAGWELIHCRRARRCIGCWCAMVW